MSKVKATSWTEYPGTKSERRFHLTLACGHTAWRAKRMSSVVCAKCRMKETRR
jgi:hypothetical protein